jgi:hypothetical protein
LDLALSANANSISLVTFGFTILSAYLLVAYIIGSKLSAMQAFAITVLYTVALLVNVAAQLDAINEAMEYKRLASELAVGIEIRLLPNTQFVIIAIRSLVYIVSLWFMWSMRHPRVESRKPKRSPEVGLLD